MANHSKSAEVITWDRTINLTIAIKKELEPREDVLIVYKISRKRDKVAFIVAMKMDLEPLKMT